LAERWGLPPSWAWTCNEDEPRWMLAMLEADRMDQRERDASKACDAFAALVRIGEERNARGVGVVPK